MLSASRHSRADLSDARDTLLLQTLNTLLRAVDGRVVLLRPLTSCFDSQCDDVDVLLTESQRHQLISAAKTACHQGRIHCRIRQGSAAKAELTLWTVDCSEKLMIDLWTSFDQLPLQPRKSISAARLLSTLRPLTRDSDIHPADETKDLRTPALHQLPPDIDLCLLLQHLAKKRKSLSDRAVRERITAACDRLAEWSPDPATVSSSPDQLQALRGLAAELNKAMIITRKNIAFTEHYLLQRLADASGNRGLRILEPRRSRGLLTELRRTLLKRRPVMAVVGSDGAGKSSVVTALSRLQPTLQAIVAKKLYRRSISYQIVSSMFKRLRGLDRGDFDDRFATLVTLRAIASLWLRLVMTRNPLSRPAQSDSQSQLAEGLTRVASGLVFDRSVGSFLIRDRKSDRPTLTRSAKWAESLIPPVTSVLLLLPFAELARRKQEMSACGHEHYQRLLFEQAGRQMPMDVIVVASMESAESAARAIRRMIETDTQSLSEPESQISPRPVRKAAA